MPKCLCLDRAFERQSQLASGLDACAGDCLEWGRRLRLACSWSEFERFRGEIPQPAIDLTFIGSGDFHHLSLALVRQIRRPFNLLVIDNHPDWMRGIPFLHCGTWLYHAARQPLVQSVFHLGGDVDFDNYYLPMAPWPLLRSGKIRVLPARRRFARGPWKHVPHQTVSESLARLAPLAEWERDLRAFPLYISLDKDVLPAGVAAVNWDSGHLPLEHLWRVLDRVCDLAGGGLAGMDVVGDWSPVETRGWLGSAMHWTMHPSLSVDPHRAAQQNETLNLRLLDWWRQRASRPAAA